MNYSREHIEVGDQYCGQFPDIDGKYREYRDEGVFYQQQHIMNFGVDSDPSRCWIIQYYGKHEHEATFIALRSAGQIREEDEMSV